MSVTARLATGLIPLIALVALATAFVAPSETPIGEASGHELVLTEVPQNWRAPEELLAPFGAGETVTRILVHVTPTAGVDSFAGWDDSSALSAHQDRVAALVDAVLADLPDGEFATLRRFDNQAGFAGLATRLGLEDLLVRLLRVSDEAFERADPGMQIGESNRERIDALVRFRQAIADFVDVAPVELFRHP